MQNNNNYNHWIDKVTASKFFTSGNDVRLLRYLISATLEEKTLKETIIAMDIFGRDSSFDPGSDSIVRSNIYNLRKKLLSYYQDEGSLDAIRFEIPKGSYQVQFIEAVYATQVKQNTRVQPLIIGLLATATIIFALLYFLNRDGEKAQTHLTQNPLWSYYIESENPLLIVLGDYFMMEKIHLPDSSYNYVRDPEINNQNDFSAYMEQNPELKINMKILGQSYFGEEIPHCFNQLLEIFAGEKKEIRMKYASELSLNDMRENDIIFVGDFVTMGILRPFFENSGFRFSNIPSSLYQLDEKLDTLEYLLLDNPVGSVFQNDYAMVSSISGYQNKRILFFLSFLPFGKSEALYKMTDPLFLDEIPPLSLPLPENWNLLMKVSGLQSSGFYYEIIRFDAAEE